MDEAGAATTKDVPAVKPPRIWRPMLLSTLGILAALALAWFIGAVVLPVWQVHRALSGLAANSLRAASLYNTWGDADGERKRAVAALGGDRQALGKLRLYLSLPKRLAPAREPAVFLVPCCGEQGLPFLDELSRRPDTKLLAFCALSLSGRPALPILKRGLDSDDPTTRRLAVCAIDELSLTTPERAELLVSALPDASWQVRAIAVNGLCRGLGPHAKQPEPALIEALASECAAVRSGAAVALAASMPRWWDQEFKAQLLPTVRPLLADPDRKVRLAAAATLVELREASEEAAAELVRQVTAGKPAIDGGTLRHPWDGGRFYAGSEDDDLLVLAAQALIRLREAPATAKLPGFEAALGKARAIIRSANAEWRTTISTGEEAPK